MGKLIEFKNTNFQYDSENAFIDFNMTINEGDIVSLIGPSGSGKTTLLKMLCHKLPNDTCYFKEEPFSSISVEDLRKDVIVVFDIDTKYDEVEKEIKRYLEMLHLENEEIDKRYNNIKKLFEIERIEKESIHTLSYQDKYLIKLLRFLIINPAFIAIDNIFANLSQNNKERFIKYIKTNKITLLNVVTNLNDTLYGNKIFVLDKYTLILEGSTSSVLKTDTLLKRLGFSLPLPVDLSIELIHYDVLKKIYTDSDKLVGALWK